MFSLSLDNLKGRFKDFGNDFNANNATVDISRDDDGVFELKGNDTTYNINNRFSGRTYNVYSNNITLNFNNDAYLNTVYNYANGTKIKNNDTGNITVEDLGNNTIITNKKRGTINYDSSNGLDTNIINNPSAIFTNSDDGFMHLNSNRNKENFNIDSGNGKGSIDVNANANKGKFIFTGDGGDIEDHIDFNNTGEGTNIINRWSGLIGVEGKGGDATITNEKNGFVSDELTNHKGTKFFNRDSGSIYLNQKIHDPVYSENTGKGQIFNN